MDESRAWITQAKSDLKAAECLVNNRLADCHVAAKFQQSVEKAVKAMVVALREVGLVSTSVGYRHEVERFMSILLRLPRTNKRAGVRDVQNHIFRLLDEPTRGSIRALDALVPKRPPAGAPSARNTEYPFEKAPNDWVAPATEGVFVQDEMFRYRLLASRITSGADRVISALRRLP